MDFCHLIELVRRFRLNEMARESVKGNKSIFFKLLRQLVHNFTSFELQMYEMASPIY